ncbi:hypothetical protein EPK99_05115 [Neorhizobium lilium]|uniref:Uncharacterized protein n=1 Tax=Neorhizobium lilium TaxID=2503024 RepID=A0A3S3VQ98_9HYPH|nr:hypothetical protein [Neorhizobium lilium]RWX81646.1 hypothetical protein EPK99_05115 [Neorhizobium lilium]
MAIIALASLATALPDAAHLGWTHPQVLVVLLVTAVSAIGFILIEAKSRAPMLAFMHGMHLSLIVAVVLLFLGAALSFFCLRQEDNTLVSTGK